MHGVKLEVEVIFNNRKNIKNWIYVWVYANMEYCIVKPKKKILIVSV